MGSYLDVEQALIDYLKAAGWANVTTERPTNLFNILPVIVVERFGGGDTGVIGIDYANVDTDVYAASRTDAKTYAETIHRQIRLGFIGFTSGGGHVSAVGTISKPAVRPFDSKNVVRRFGMSHRVTTHSGV